MADRGGHQRTHRESNDFRSEIIKLRAQNKYTVEIAKELNVTKLDFVHLMRVTNRLYQAIVLASRYFYHVHLISRLF